MLGMLRMDPQHANLPKLGKSLHGEKPIEIKVHNQHKVGTHCFSSKPHSIDNRDGEPWGKQDGSGSRLLGICQK